MPVTISYDLTNIDNNKRTYIRSMLERFGWKRLGGSVFRYSVINNEEEWLNDIAPSIMFFRSYIRKYGIEVKYFTLDTQSVAHIDHSDPTATLGEQPLAGGSLTLRAPTNVQSAEKEIRQFVDAAVAAIK
jgi:hypothetical protein